MRVHPRPMTGGRLALGACLAVAAMSLPLLAHAGDLTGSVGVRLLAPGGAAGDLTPVDLSDAVAIGPGVEIIPGDGTQVGSFLLSASEVSESIDIAADQIHLRILQGATEDPPNDHIGITGYLGAGGQHARYEFSGLSVAGEAITGLSYAVGDGGLSNLAALQSASFIRLTSSHSFVLELDGLIFADRGHDLSNNYADFSISFQTTPVPEPSVAGLSLTGLVLVGACMRRRQRLSA